MFQAPDSLYETHIHLSSLHMPYKNKIFSTFLLKTFLVMMIFILFFYFDLRSLKQFPSQLPLTKNKKQNTDKSCCNQDISFFIFYHIENWLSRRYDEKVIFVFHYQHQNKNFKVSKYIEQAV